MSNPTDPAAPSSRNILVVEDQEDFREVVHSILTASGYSVFEAADAKTAQSILALSSIDCVISDIRMPGMNGIELLHYVKRSHPKLPVVLMTGFSELATASEAAELGAQGFLAKPFNKADLLDLLAQIFPPSADQSATSLDADYCKLMLDDFISGKTILYDIYIRISSARYVKVAHANTEIEIERIKSYKEKNVHFLYMRKADFKRYVGFNLRLLEAVGDSPRFDKDKKANLLKHTGDLIMESVMIGDLDAESFSYAKSFVEASVETASEDDDIYFLLQGMKDNLDWLYAHCLAVSVTAVMLAKRMGWRSGQTLLKVSMGSLMHDIGLREIDSNIWKKRRIELTPAEIAIYETHPIRGHEILSQIPNVPTDVMEIALQHHEDIVGSGYPYHLKKESIHPLARLIAVADEFCYLVLKKPTGEGVDPLVAVQKLVQLKIDRLDPQFLLALIDLCNAPIPEALAKKTLNKRNTANF